MTTRTIYTRPGKRLDVSNDGSGGLIIGETWDNEPALKAAHILGDGNAVNTEAMRQQAVIPPDVLARSLKEAWTPEDWKRWANDPDNARFRVAHNGRIQRI